MFSCMFIGWLVVSIGAAFGVGSILDLYWEQTRWLILAFPALSLGGILVVLNRSDKDFFIYFLSYICFLGGALALLEFILAD